jgi:hypothetical protein
MYHNNYYITSQQLFQPCWTTYTEEQFFQYRIKELMDAFVSGDPSKQTKTLKPQAEWKCAIEDRRGDKFHRNREIIAENFLAGRDIYSNPF